MKKLMMVGCLALFACVAQAQLSVETLGVLRHNNIHDGVSWGAGADIGYGFNRYVMGHVRTLSYTEADWRGSAVDELGVYVEANIYKYKGLTLSAIGGGIRDFETDDWGFSVGPRIRVALFKNVGFLAEEQVEARINATKNLKTVFGLYYSF